MNYSEQLEQIWEKARQTIIERVKYLGTDSVNINGNVIKVDDERSFNLAYGSYVVEVGEDLIIDENGNTYAYGVLTHEQLCELADFVDSAVKYFQPDFGDDDTLVTPDGTELWSYYVYSTLDKAKEDFPDREILTYSGDEIENPYFIK